MRSPAVGLGATRDASPSSERDSAPPARSPLKFFLLLFALSAPFWLIGGLTDLKLMPGLSVSALMAVCPMVAALILVHRESGKAGVKELLRRSFDFKRIKAKRWYAPILFLMAVVNVAVYGLMRWMDMPLPAAQILVPAALLMFLAFFVGALGEELGWSAYITDPLQDRWNALQTGVILGVVAVLWHIVPLLLIHRSPTWIAWWCLYAMAARILIVWLYNNTGKSVFAVALFHATLNLSWMLFPVYGSHFDMPLGGLVMAFTATIVTVVWGPAALVRYKND
jgi:membrane protease YdiL (CAAX protease family)